jgi:hypothetical protein
VADEIRRPLARVTADRVVLRVADLEMAADNRAPSRLMFVFMAGAFYYSTFLFFWPLSEPQTRLPFYPVMAIIVAPCLLLFADALLKRTHVFLFIFPSLIVAAEIALIARGGSPFTNSTTDKIGLIANVLKLTDESDYVMDSKGETIYRWRPIYHVLDRITRRRMHRHLIRDDITERLIETQTALIATTPGCRRVTLPLSQTTTFRLLFGCAHSGKWCDQATSKESQPTSTW